MGEYIGPNRTYKTLVQYLSSDSTDASDASLSEHIMSGWKIVDLTVLMTPSASIYRVITLEYQTSRVAE